MRACVQRVTRARVMLPESHQIVGEIDHGLLILLGVGVHDTQKKAIYLANKSAELRIFSDENGKMNRSVYDVGGKILVVSQFTLFADCAKGRRPSFTEAANPDTADALYRFFVDVIRQKGIDVQTGAFRQDMHIELVNDGPVTIWLDTDERCNA